MRSFAFIIVFCILTITMATTARVGADEGDVITVEVLVMAEGAPLAGAHVALDLNADGVWNPDLDEPFAWSDGNGIAHFAEVLSVSDIDGATGESDGAAAARPVRLMSGNLRGSVGASNVSVDFVTPDGADLVNLDLYDVRGRRLARVRGPGDLQLDVPAALPAGVYFLRLSLDSGEAATHRLTSAGRRLRGVTATRMINDQAMLSDGALPAAAVAPRSLRSGHAINVIVSHEDYPAVVQPASLTPGEHQFVIQLGDEPVIRTLALTFFPGSDSRPLPPPAGWSSRGGTRWNEVEADVVHVFDDPAERAFFYMQASVGDGMTACSSPETHRISTRCFQDGSFGGASASVAKLYFDFERFLPANTTIVDAILTVQDAGASSVTAFNATQGLVAVLDTFELDGRWLDAAGGCNSNQWSKRANWRYADIDLEAPWKDGTLTDRAFAYQYGLTGDLTYRGMAPFTAGVDTLVFDVARQIQYAMDYGRPNHGFWLLAIRGNTTRFYLACGVNELHNRDRNPTLWIRYREASHTQPWNGHAFAWSFGTDDQCIDQLAYPAVMEAHAPGARMTWWLSGATWLDPNQDWAVPRQTIPANRILPATALELFLQGHEIAQHTRTHGSRRQWPIYGSSLIASPAGLASVDSMLYEIERRWLTDIIGIADTMAVAGIARPGGGYGAIDVVGLAATGYRYGRGSWVGPHHSVPAAFNSSQHEMFAWQSVNRIQNLALGDTVNIFSLDNSLSTNLIFGPSYDHDKATAFANLDRIFDLAWRNGQYPLLTFSHGFADRALSACPTYETSVLDVEQLEWIMEYMTQRRDDVWIARLIDIVDRYREIATPVAPPSSVDGYSVGVGGRYGINADSGIYWYAPPRGPWVPRAHVVSGPAWPPVVE